MDENRGSSISPGVRSSHESEIKSDSQVEFRRARERVGSEVKIKGVSFEHDSGTEKSRACGGRNPGVRARGSGCPQAHTGLKVGAEPPRTKEVFYVDIAG